MKKISLAEFVKDFITHIDANILTLSENQIDTLIEDIHDEQDILQQLLIEVEKKRDYYFQKQNHYDYTAFKSIALYATFLMVFAGIWYSISVYYYRPLYKEFTALTKELESFGITAIRNKTEAEITLVAETAKQFNPTEAVIVKNLIQRIYAINLNLHNSAIKWAQAILTILIALLIKPTYNSIGKFLWPKYKDRNEKYCLIEQKLRKAIIASEKLEELL